KHSRVLTENLYHNGHPDLVVQGVYAGNSVMSGTEGIEIKTTRKAGGAVDTHGARDQWMCVWVYDVDNKTEPARDRQPMKFTEVYLGEVKTDDFRKNARGELGTRTASKPQASSIYAANRSCSIATGRRFDIRPVCWSRFHISCCRGPGLPKYRYRKRSALFRHRL